MLTFRLKQNAAETQKNTGKQIISSVLRLVEISIDFLHLKVNMVMDYANIIDNGAYSIKIGKSTQNDPK